MNERYLSRHNTSFIDIDATLKPSVDKKLLWGACLWVVVGILALVPLSLTYKILLGMVAIASLWFGQVSSCHLLAISSLHAKPQANNQTLPYDNFDFLTWQIQWVRGVVKVPRHHKQAVWQANLLGIADMGCLVILTFGLIESAPTKISVTIWQDQVDRDTWRQFKVLANTVGQ